MVLQVVKYGTPVLRQKGDHIESLTAEVQRLIVDMFDTMYAHKGIGLAAQQVGVPLQLTVIDVRGVTDRPSSMEKSGKTMDVGRQMPMVLINPQVTAVGAVVAGPEGCLSFPEVYADIPRPEEVEVSALDGTFSPIHFRCGGLLARAVQHEVDHLNGILFIDRMSKEDKLQLKPELEELQAATKKALRG